MVHIDQLGLQKNRPIHLMLGMMAISEHSMVEAAVANILVAMLPSDPAPAAAIFGVIRNGRLQKDALLRAAETVAPEEDVDRLEKVMRIVDKAAKVRDTLAHQVWGWDDGHPDKIVLFQGDYMWKLSLQSRVLNDKGGPSVEEAEGVQALMRDACTLWTRQDLVDARDRSVRAFSAAIAFVGLMKAKNVTQKANERETLDVIISQAFG